MVVAMLPATPVRTGHSRFRQLLDGPNHAGMRNLGPASAAAGANGRESDSQVTGLDGWIGPQLS